MLESLRVLPASGARNRRLVMMYLVPLSMLLGQMPRAETLAAYQLDDVYGGIVQALRLGDLRLFEASLQHHRPLFLKTGVYLLIQQHLRNYVLRALFRRVCVGRTRVPRSCCVAAHARATTTPPRGPAARHAQVLVAQHQPGREANQA